MSHFQPTHRIKNAFKVQESNLNPKRTLSLPPFFKHWGTDTSIEEKSTPVPAYTRLDVDVLRKFIPVIKPEVMAENCDHKIDAYWAARRDY